MEDPLSRVAGGSPVVGSEKGNQIWLLVLLASLHLSGCLGHFLLSVVSKSVASDIHYGSRACLSVNHSSGNECSTANSSLTCSVIKDCSWGWTGLGLEYQLLVGPAFMAVFTIASVGWGIAADNFKRISRLGLLSISSVLFSTALLLTAYADSYGELVVLRMVSALGIAGLGPIAPGLIYDLFGEKHRAMAMGFFHWGIYLGGGLSNAVGKGVSDLHLFAQGWRGAFLVSGFPGLILALLLVTTASDPGRKEGGLPSISSGGSCHGVYLSSQDTAGGGGDEEIEEDDEDRETDREDEAQVLIKDVKNSSAYQNIVNNNSINSAGDKKQKITRSSVLSFLLKPSVLLLGIGACVRQSAGYSWAYNGALYFQTYYTSFDASWWLTWSTILGGSAGVVVGGAVSDRLVSRLGLSARALVLAASQICAAPFALGVLWTDPPYSFAFLLVTYLFAEMWYGVVYAILVELMPSSGKSLGMAVALFVINNIGGNAPVLAAPLSVLTSYRVALTLLYPAGLLASSVLFICGYVSLRRQYL